MNGYYYWYNSKTHIQWLLHNKTGVHCVSFPMIVDLYLKDWLRALYECF